MSSNKVMPNAGLYMSDCNNPEQNAARKLPKNKVMTAKYTPLTFLPKNLFMQFSRLANIYFLIISVIQTGPFDLSPTAPYVTSGPFALILLLNMLREIFEDSARHKDDNEVNNRIVEVVQHDGTLVKTKWQDLALGDIVKIVSNSEFPADLIALSSSGDQGMCYIDTCNLDGETNLKIRNSLNVTHKLVDPAALCKLEGHFEYDRPNKRLYNFTGKLTQASGDSPVDNDNILLRGSVLRNTDWIFGQIIYTGPETKIMMNMQKGRVKMSNVEKTVNFLFVGILTLEAIVISIATIGMAIWIEPNRTAWYLPYVENQTSRETGLAWLTFLILFNNYVPISLYISLEIAKSVQGMMMNWDEEMYHAETDTAALTRTTNLNEELGQVQYIFSDKTGTLTQNVMEFRKCFIGGTSYGFGTTEIGEAAAKRGADVGTPDPAAVEAEKMQDPEKAQFYRDAAIGFSDTRLLQRVKEGHKDAETIRDFMRILSVSHTVVPAGDLTDPHKIEYKAESPDEGALTLYAKSMGWFFCGKSSSHSTIKALGVEEKYDVLNINKFNSSRKRMSSVVRTPEGKLVLYVKGADNVMCERLAPGQALEKPMLDQLGKYATEGLRTLVLGMKELSEEEYKEWDMAHKAATTALEDRDGELERAAELIEKDMIIVGATAIEDKLQVGVPDTIALLAKAGVKIWVLTGDKQETAENIGFACQLLRDDMTLEYVNADDAPEVKGQIKAILEKHKALIGQETEHLALIITGKALISVMDDAEMTKDLLTFGRMCKAVVACRVSPDQKRQVVTMVRLGIQPQPMTLSIGDGANDVPMILEAHIGVGISGNEGMQAVRSADYAIAQFRFLKRLMLVHGRTNYRRVSVMILYSLYKQVLLVTTLFWYCVYNGFSGTTVFSSYVLTGYNIAYTSLPVIFLGFLDQDVKPKTMDEHPQLYMAGQRNLSFNFTMLFVWMANGLVHCLICYFVPHFAFSAMGVDDLGVFGTCIMNAMAISANVRLVFEANHISFLSHGIVAFSIAAFYGVCIVLAAMWPAISLDDYAGVALNAWGSSLYWLVLLLTVISMNVIDMCFFYAHRMFFPNPTYVVQELDRGYAKRADAHLVQEAGNPAQDGRVSNTHM